MRFRLKLASLAFALPLTALAQQTLLATPTTVAWGYYWTHAKPVLTIHSGETVRVQTLSTCGPPARLLAGGVKQDDIPQYVTDIYNAAPGDVLEIRIQKIDIDVPWSCNGFSVGRGFLPDDFPFGKMTIIP